MIFHNNTEEITGGASGFITSLIIYYDRIGDNLLNSGFVLLNTCIAVVASHYLKKFFTKNDKR